MSRQYKIFISYPTINKDDTFSSFISNIKSFLLIILKKLLKNEVTINLSGESKSKIKYDDYVALLLILNENNNAKEFQDELKAIANSVKGNEQNQIFKIFTNKNASPILPGIFNPLIEYDFFLMNEETGQISDFMKLTGRKEEKLFWLKIVDLAYDIYNGILITEKHVFEKEKNNTIFLAETGEDQKINRDIIKRELLQFGYNVLPGKHIDMNHDDYKSIIKQNLESSRMSIHIIGKDYMRSMDGESICAKCNDIASAYYLELEQKNNIKNFKRIVWISPDLNLRTEKQRNHIEQLKQDELALRGAEVVQTPIELLKTIIHSRLMEDSGNNNGNIITDSNKEIIYLVYDKEDIEIAKKISDFYTTKKYQILLTDFEGNEYELIKEHKAKLVACDRILIYYNGNNEWLVSKLKDILKSPGFGRTKPFKSKAIYYSEEDKLNIDKFDTKTYLMLKSKAVFDSNLLEKLIKKEK